MNPAVASVNRFISILNKKNQACWPGFVNHGFSMLLLQADNAELSIITSLYGNIGYGGIPVSIDTIYK